MYSLIKEITFKISSYCNLACVYCFQTHDIKERNDVFRDYEALTRFVSALPTRDALEIKMTGGEVSLFIDEMRHAVKSLRKVERRKDLQLRPTVITNGTRMGEILELLDDGILYPHGTKVSWDGIYSASKSRKPKGGYTDAHFNEQIKLVGQSKWNKDVLIRTAVTEDTVDDLYTSLLFALDSGCRKWEYYFISDYDRYGSADFNRRFQKQIELIAKEYVKRYDDLRTRWTYSNWDNMYFANNMSQDAMSKMRAVSCRHLGRGLYIAYDGRVFPCGYFDSFSRYSSGGEFGEPVKYTLGTIYDGIDETVAKEFVSEYLNPPTCDYTTCGNMHCFECPAANKKRIGELNAKHCRTCGMLTAERNVFKAISPEVPFSEIEETLNGRFSFMDAWNFNEFRADGYLNLPLRGKFNV